MAQVGGAVIDQQEETERERPGMTWALRSLYRPSAKSALTHHQQAGGGMACGHRAPSGGNRGRDGSAISFPLPVYTADANGGLCIGRSRVDHWGLGGLRPPTSGTGYIPVHCLPLL